jgi:hypothetical protein
MKAHATLLALAGMLLASAAASGGQTTFDVFLNGFNEVTAGGVPNQGDPDGFGMAHLVIDDSVSPPSITWQITVQNILLPLSGAHIHQGASTTTGPVRVDFSAMLAGGPLQDADLTGVLADPTGWYVNVHNSVYPGGAIRGQIPAPGTVALLAAAGVIACRRRVRMNP